MYGKEVLDYIKPGGKIFSTTELIGDSQNEGSEYYLLFSGQNKAYEHDIEFLGAGCLPVRRYSDEDMAKEMTEAFIDKLDLDIQDEYIYKDSYGNPYINMSQFICFNKEGSPYNYGIQQKVYTIQVLDESVENGKTDSFRRSLEEINYVTNMREVQMDQAYEKYKLKKKQDIRAMLPIPSSYGQAPPTVGTIKFSEVNPLAAENITNNIARLARNTVGVDPNRLEIQRAEGLGIRELLQEEKTEIIQKIATDNAIVFERRVEKIINFFVVHDGLDLKNVLIEYNGIGKSPTEGVRFQLKKTISIADAAAKLKKWNYQVIVTVEDAVKRSNAIVAERIFSMLERIDPNAYPDLWKKLILKLNDTSQLNISSEDLIQQANAEALGGASQFKSNGGGGGEPAQGNVAPIPGQNLGAPTNAPSSLGPELDAGQQQQ